MAYIYPNYSNFLNSIPFFILKCEYVHFNTRWYLQNPGWMVNSVESDQTPRSEASNLVLYSVWEHLICDAIMFTVRTRSSWNLSRYKFLSFFFSSVNCLFE